MGHMKVKCSTKLLCEVVVCCILATIFLLGENHRTDANVTTTISCPLRCLCFRTAVRCMFLHLENIPQVPQDTTLLDLRFNRIKDIPVNQFKHLSELHTLLLNNNQITELKNGAFNGLKKLKYLFLYKNRIRDIESFAFSGLNDLEQLYLHYNYITTLKVEMFADLYNLERLFLHNNNRIQRIPVGIFDNMKKLHRLRLDGNALVCDCGMMSFAQMLNSHKDSLAAAAVCEHPLDMKGKSVLMMENIESHCSKPTITEEPTDIEVRFGNTVQFRCRADGNPTPNIIWLHNNNEINTQLPPRYSVMDDGTLMIANINDEDMGSYECVARSMAGEVKSRRALVNIRNPINQRPRFVKLPIDQEVTEGQNQVNLTCEATGVPAPTIRWYHNQIQILPSPLVEVSDTFLLLKNIKKDHYGSTAIFRCEATNILGNISTVAQIRFIVGDVPPTWLSTPSETLRIVALGENIEMRCIASGTPAAKVLWFINDQQVVSSERIRIDSDGSRLQIIHADNVHHGEWKCRAENRAGFVEAIMNIRIVGGQAPIFTHDLKNLTFSQKRLVPGLPVTLSCSATANPPESIQYIWRKDLLTVNSGNTLILHDFNPDEDSGTYTCSAFNDWGYITSDEIVIDRNRLFVRNREPSDSDIISDAYKQAKYEVESAENQSLRTLFDTEKKNVLSPVELLRLTRFPRGEGRFIARPAEIYERALSIIKQQLDKGMKINVTKDFSYDDLLTKSQLETLGRLSGCISHRRPQADCNLSKCFNNSYRSIDGTCNNPNMTMWGASYTPFNRMMIASYENGFNLPKGWTSKVYNGYELPLAREITNKIITTESITPDSNYTHMLMQWGQFLDHDLDHALPSLSIEAFGERISCRRTCENVSPCFPMQAPNFDPTIRTRKCMEFTRSAGVCGSGVTSILFDSIQQREQINQLTSFVDASQVYGSSMEELIALRSKIEPIYLKTGIFMFPDKPLMPFATDDNFVDCRRNFRESDIGCFLGGDIRANEQVGLIAMHTVWFRQHNFLARQLRHFNPQWGDETVFQETRKIVGAQMQHISYSEWLPKIVGTLGIKEMGIYKGYNPKINPTITNEFATAAMRFGHTLINPTLRRLDENFQTIREGDIPLRHAFFAPWRIVEEGGIDPILRGLFDTPAKLKKSNEFLNSHLTNDLFGHAHLIALDLASMNIQRSRDHGLQFYNEYRELCGLKKAYSFEDLKVEIPDRELRNKLQEVYKTVNNIDLWVGGVAEQPETPDARVGPTFRCILIDQFKRLRDGDRFWYENENIFNKEQIEEIKRTTLARVLCDTGDSVTHVKQDVFSMKSNLVNCNVIPPIRLNLWNKDECCGGPNRFREELCTNRYLRSSYSNEIRKKRYVKSIDQEDLTLIELPHTRSLYSFYNTKFETIESALTYFRNTTRKN